MPNEELPVPLFRAYIRRKPSGLLLVTVLSAALPRPVFRSYPLDIVEAAAVERSVGHAMYALKKCAPSKCQQSDNPCFKTVFPCCHEQHEGYSDNSCEQNHSLLPAVNVVTSEALHRALPCGPEDEHGHADKCEEQHTAEGHSEFKQLGGWEKFQHGSPPRLQQDCAEHPLQPPVKFTQHGSPHGLHQPCTDAAVRSDQQAGAEGYAVKQHLTLRVVWQGLL